MTDRAQYGMSCSQFEALLAEALDSVEVQRGAGVADELAAVPVDARAAFAEHRQSCPNCGPLYAGAREGMLLLKGLEEIEPPRNLVHNILAVTSRVESTITATSDRKTQASRLRGWRPFFAGILRSRFAASFCMAFFSLSLTLSLAGVKFSDIARVAAHPVTLRKTVEFEYTQLQARVMRYYDNMRLVYEMQSRVRELKQAATPAQSEDKGTAQPDQQNWNQPTPVFPNFKEVVQPQKQNAYSRENQRGHRQLNIAYYSARRLPDLTKLSDYPSRPKAGRLGTPYSSGGLEIAESMRKIEGAQI